MRTLWFIFLHMTPSLPPKNSPFKSFKCPGAWRVETALLPFPFPSPPLLQNLKRKFGSRTSGPVLRSACIFVLRVINASHLPWPQGLADLSVAEHSFWEISRPYKRLAYAAIDPNPALAKQLDQPQNLSIATTLLNPHFLLSPDATKGHRISLLCT